MSGLLLLDGRERVGNYRRFMVCVCASSHAAEDEQVEEVHPAENEEHQADFDGQGFNTLLRRADDVAELQGQADVAEIDEIEADDEQVIDGVGKGFIAVEDVDEENSSVFVEGASHPDGQGGA